MEGERPREPPGVMKTLNVERSHPDVVYDSITWPPVTGMAWPVS